MNSPKGVKSGVPERVSISCPTCGTRHNGTASVAIAYTILLVGPYNHIMHLHMSILFQIRFNFFR